MRCASVGVSIGASCVGSLRFLSVFASCSTAVAAEEKERDRGREREREKTYTTLYKALYNCSAFVGEKERQNGGLLPLNALLLLAE